MEYPFFPEEKGYGDYPPLDVRRILTSLNVDDESVPTWAMQHPGFPLYDERHWLANPALCAEPFESCPGLASDDDLGTVQSGEIFVAIRRRLRFAGSPRRRVQIPDHNSTVQS